MKIKQRIVCPCCGKGFIERDEDVIGFETFPRMHNPDYPRCRKCGRRFTVSFNTLDFTITIEKA